MSTVLLGRRRMGKTEIFKRLVNRLFFRRDHGDPKAVVPVCSSLPDWVKSPEGFVPGRTSKFHAPLRGFLHEQAGVDLEGCPGREADNDHKGRYGKTDMVKRISGDKGNVEADVVVIGSGFAGMAAAIEAANAGAGVVILEKMSG